LCFNQYLGDLLPEPFDDGSKNSGVDIIIRYRGLLEEKPLKLKEFYNEIDSKEGFYQESINNNLLSTLW